MGLSRVVSGARAINRVGDQSGIPPIFTEPQDISWQLGSIGHVTDASSTRPAPVTACRVMVFSDNAITRAEVISALGPRPDPELPPIIYVEVATAAMAFDRLDAGVIDVAVLDGEARPAGGMGVAKQMRDEIDPCPPILLLLARADDRWLADWSRADATAVLPVDPLTFGSTFATLLKESGFGAPNAQDL